jgi:hypothetical protein
MMEQVGQLVSSMATARDQLAGCRNTNSCFSIWWYYRNSNTVATEEFNQSSSIITAAAWASGGNMTTARRNLGGAGTQTAAIGLEVIQQDLYNSTEEYNGSTWTNTWRKFRNSKKRYS